MADPILHLARITIETLSHLSLRTGADSSGNELPIVTDASGLPAIPGTVLAGACKRCCCRTSEHQAPIPAFSWAHIHNSRDIPVDGLDHERLWQRDPLLATFFLRDLPRRGQIRLGERCSAVQRVRFEYPAIQPGHRFTFEMSLRGTDGRELSSRWDQVKTALVAGDFRLGAAISTGYGSIRVKRLAEARLDLRNPKDFQAYALHPRRLDQASELLRERPAHHEDHGEHWLALTLFLQADDFWRCGGGNTPLLSSAGWGSDALPLTEERIVWTGGAGRIAKQQVVLPASVIKGALAHRTAFHHNRLSGQFAGNAENPGKPTDNPAVWHLFGHVDSASGATRAGGVRIDDVTVEKPIAAKMVHNSLDRFTGGVREGVLFTEEALLGQSLSVKIRVDRCIWESATESIRRAFRTAIDDLIDGRLALGASASRGLGFFQGQVVMDELGATSP